MCDKAFTRLISARIGHTVALTSAAGRALPSPALGSALTMWTVVGPFDGEEDNKVDFKKTKLLRPGNSYVVSRKVGPLVVKHKSISRKHLVFEVAECSEEDIEDPDHVPKLTLHNTGAQARKGLHIDGTDFVVNKDGSTVLKDGDTIVALHDIVITAKWEKLACCYPPTVTDVKAEDCARLAIPVVSKPHPSVNYHLTPTYTLTPAIATSLLNTATFVKPTWLTELIAHYAPLDTPDSGKDYHVPSTSTHRPAFSPALPSSLKNHRSWEPNEARTSMLQGHRVLFVGERGREAGEDYKELVKQGGGTYECCAVQGGRKALHDVLAKAQGKGARITLVADATAMVAAVGQDEWDGIVEEVTGYGLRFISSDNLVQAVVHVDLAYIDCGASQNRATQSGSSIPDVVLNTHPEEPSAPPSLPPAGSAEAKPEPAPSPPQRKLVRRAATGQPSAEPEPSSSTTANTTPALEAATNSGEPPQEEQPFKLRRPLVRRTVTKANDNVIVGVGDTSMAMDGTTSATNDAPKPVEDLLLFRRPINLKRRHGGAAPALQPPPLPPPSQLIVERPSGDEPPHKKFRALFEESDPDRIASQLPVAQIGTSGSAASGALSSQTQTESAIRTQARARELASVPEEEEVGAEASASSGMREPQKRKARDEDEDVEMQDTDDARPVKRRGASGEPATAPPQASSSKPAAPTIFTNAANKPASSGQKPPSTGQKSHGAAAGKPDTDEAFLKAVASTKRGKKHEDDFDREFNKLRISKPEVQRVDPEEQWKVLDDFGDDNDVRGNFMVVVEMDLIRKDRREGRSGIVTDGSGRRDWEGRPNFKKFKKRAINERLRPIELILSNEDDMLGFKDEPDDNAPSFPRSESQRRLKNDPLSPVSKLQRPRRQLRDSDSEVPPPKAFRPKASRPQKKSTLFVESDPEDEDEAAVPADKDASQRDDMGSDAEISPNSTIRTETQRRSQQSGLGSRRREPAPADDDSDNEMVFKGFGAGRSQRTQRSTQRR
ncbi:uncharacterized protein PHACADRAFT_206756 [Phanerochaete carnosa HHB-10118-sp]|uniref:FHA domain-containing protein n=1 Tax=Phanerochaete carnosa (strain HHB-10118-sp) TaxID=650164 RepID=K5WF41_PHACS|nr:uncharacterized protein PHACADRAFT_206756 [Phanerochaete carnosa HHB-10118-sp]EKM57885.1 hypothetical protein PHACADRAFT_206756 [Phanerochaete carnosa HHB-10118-sp]